MKKATQILILLITPLFLLVTACNSIANLKTATEYDKSVNFTDYVSYKFLNEVSYSDTFDNYSSENKRTIENAIHKQLKRKEVQVDLIHILHKGV